MKFGILSDDGIRNFLVVGKGFLMHLVGFHSIKGRKVLGPSCIRTAQRLGQLSQMLIGVMVVDSVAFILCMKQISNIVLTLLSFAVRASGKVMFQTTKAVFTHHFVHLFAAAQFVKVMSSCKIVMDTGSNGVELFRIVPNLTPLLLGHVF